MRPKELEEKSEAWNRIGNKSIEMPTVTLDIQFRLVLPAQKQAWKSFWQKLLMEAKGGGDK